MAKNKKMQKALVLSIVAMILCVAMLAGTTFAWFTDSATSSGNRIQAGNLKVDLLMWNGEKYDTIADGTGNLFQDGADTANNSTKTRWEPGKTQVVYLAVENKGDLSLKYHIDFFATDVDSDDAVNAVEAFEYVILSGDQSKGTFGATNWNELKALDNATYGELGAVKTTEGKLVPATLADRDVYSNINYIALFVHMKESAGNEYMGKTISVDVKVNAGQLAYEEDSFGADYDKNASINEYRVNDTKYPTAQQALAAAKDGDKVYLSGLDTPIVIDKKIELTITDANIVAGEGTSMATFRANAMSSAEPMNAITVNADATIIVNGLNTVVGSKNADGIYIAKDVTLTLTGEGKLIAKGNGGSESQEEYNAKKGGSGIDVAGTIVIKNLNALVAEGYGWHAFGIGGETKSITIENSTIEYAKGGMVQTEFLYANYGKQEPEAGAAIGSYTDGAVIDITNSTIVKAEGGSKAAGIGAMYHTGVTITITDSDVTAYGGNASAGIGGSRVERNATENDAITVTIKNSTVNAFGGQYGAGIGAGYDNRCQRTTPVTTVTIDADSKITAEGGLLGAGIGTGHNVINFVDNIDCDTTNVKAGSSEDPDWCCGTYPTSTAEDVGLGVLNRTHLPETN